MRRRRSGRSGILLDRRLDPGKLIRDKAIRGHAVSKAAELVAWVLAFQAKVFPADNLGRRIVM